MKKDHTWANLSLLVTTIIYIFINGAGAFETLVIVPKWAANPPASLAMFKGEYGLDFKNFWIAAHSVHELSFIVAIFLNWKIAARRKLLLIVFVLHIALRVWTILYFAPAIIGFQQIPVTEVADETLRQRAQQWKNLNLLREGLFTLLSLILVPLNQKKLV
jgi:hypothetical protein